MFGINRVIISGNATDRFTYQETRDKGIPACSFSLVSDRMGPNGGTVSAYVKINAYGPRLTRLCKTFLQKGVYVLVEGELMNRSGKFGEDLMEIRASQIIFNTPKRTKSTDDVHVHSKEDRESDDDRVGADEDVDFGTDE